MTGRLLTADDVAAMLGVGRDWIYAEARAGRIPHVPLGRYVRFRPEAIDAWLGELERGRVGDQANGRAAR
jgi:excisionase family DNA binding protein